MSRKAHKFSAVLFSLLLTAVLAACGSDKREGAGTAATVARVSEGECRVCHSTSIDPVSATGIIQEFLDSAHNPGDPNNPTNEPTGCQGCHGGGAQHHGVGPIPFPDPLASDRCKECHANVPTAAVSRDFVANCAPCHTDTGAKGLHGAQAISTLPGPNDCIGCHDVAAPQHGPNLVGDNNGVRAIVAEFSKWSHHVTGVNLQNAHCAACHLEGRVVAGAIAIDPAYHMVDNKTHLRNADTDADMQWEPSAPNHSTMDLFCMSCHDADGATSTQSAAIRALMVPAAGKTASASNPFGDTISNRYDKMQRPAVVDASSQFDTTNNSHHAVKGPRYSGNSRLAGLDANGNARRQIASPGTFASNSSATLQGVRSTMFDAGNLNQLYTPLENAGGEAAPRTGAKNLGDDSTLHCGDCHTVGQWQPGSSTTANGSDTTAAIGAHGSNNEYLLRNSIGTDQRHTQNAFLVGNAAQTVLNPSTGQPIPNGVVLYTNPDGAFLVCYNCHNYDKYGSIFAGTGVVGGHAGEYDAAGRCNGVGNTLPFNGYTTGAAADGTQFLSRFAGPISQHSSPAPYPGEQNPDYGVIFGIQCLNCHNSGTGNGYGGIHGSARNSNTLTATTDPSVTGGAYIDGMGNTTKVQRFLPGLGNAMYVPGTLGGFTGGVDVGPITNVDVYTYRTGGISNAPNGDQKAGNQPPPPVIPASGAVTNVARAGAGCYTLADVNQVLEQSHNNPTAATNGLIAPSIDGGATATSTVFGNWGGCVDHDASQGAGDHGPIKKIVRPITY